ncbi:lantibiotic dehydratase [Nocardia sp. NPDC088792]|uniref:lantibiotic dehydratase n=1 Tax=Nocardia sp. NPDC088792 TaxID=3364332 RepID=UPI0037F4E502
MPPKSHPPRWGLARVVVLRQAGFPIELLDPLVAPELTARASALARRRTEARELATRLRAELRGVRGPGGHGIHHRLNALRALTPNDLDVAGAGTGDAGVLAAEYQGTVAGIESDERNYRTAFDQRLHSDRRRVAAMFAEDDALRQVLLVANSAKYEQFSRWLAGNDDLDGKRGRTMTDLLAMYLQRVAGKGESHAHFGPITVGRITDRPEAGWTGVDPPTHYAWLNHWSVSRLAESAAADPALHGLLRPRRHPWAFSGPDCVALYADRAVREFRPTDAEDWLWQRCDGEHTIADLRTAWDARYPHDAGRADAALERMTDAGIVIAEFEVPAGVRTPSHVLLRGLERLPGGTAAEVSDRIAELNTGIARFAHSTGTAGRAAALTAVRQGFEHLTNSSPDRLSGRYYADRTVFRENVLSGLRDLRLGKAFADFMTGEFTEVYAVALAAPRLRMRGETEILARWLRDRFGADRAVPMDRLYRRFHTDRAELADECAKVADRAARLEDDLLATLLEGAPDGAHEVVLPAGRMREIVRALPDGPAAVLNPDVQLAAPDPEAVAGGNFRAVVGDFHAVRELLTQTPYAALIEDEAPEVTEEVYAGLRSLLDEDEVLVDLSRNVRAVRLVLPCHDLTIRDRSPKPPGQVLHPSDLSVVLRGDRPELRARGVDGRLRLTAPPASALSLAEDPLFPFAFPRRSGGPALDPGSRTHLPRIRCGRAVLMRELWRIPGDRFRSPGSAPDPAAEYRAAQRLRAEFELPRHVFARVAGEPKPIYLDWDAPLLVRQLFRLARRSAEPVTVTEMYPAPGQLWLRIGGRHHVSEVRAAVFSPRPPLSEEGAQP